jgi:hypothetical protein
MTVSEAVVASCLFLGCLGGSLQLWDAAAGAGVAEESRQRLRERVEGELMGSEARLRDLSRQRSPSADCAAQGRALLADLAAGSVPVGLRRRIESVEDGLLLQVSVDADGLQEPRQRIWSPAGFGLCGSAPLPPDPPPSEPAGEQP